MAARKPKPRKPRKAPPDPALSLFPSETAPPGYTLVRQHYRRVKGKGKRRSR
jgi:hypothetical protein